MIKNRKYTLIFNGSLSVRTNNDGDILSIGFEMEDLEPAFEGPFLAQSTNTWREVKAPGKSEKEELLESLAFSDGSLVTLVIGT